MSKAVLTLSPLMYYNLYGVLPGYKHGSIDYGRSTDKGDGLCNAAKDTHTLYPPLRYRYAS